MVPTAPCAQLKVADKHIESNRIDRRPSLKPAPCAELLPTMRLCVITLFPPKLIDRYVALHCRVHVRCGDIAPMLRDSEDSPSVLVLPTLWSPGSELQSVQEVASCNSHVTRGGGDSSLREATICSELSNPWQHFQMSCLRFTAHPS
jgi:hypothetical protein